MKGPPTQLEGQTSALEDSRDGWFVSRRPAGDLGSRVSRPDFNNGGMVALQRIHLAGRPSPGYALAAESR